MSEADQKRVWIIGASAGIGAALASLLSAKGYFVFLSARNDKELVQVQKNLEHSDKSKVIGCDVTDIKSLKQAKLQIGTVDLVVFAAGTYMTGGLEKFDLETYKGTIEINLMGALNVFSVLKDDIFSGHPIHLAWIASASGYRGLPNANAYGISKAGLQYFCQIQRAELPPNVKVQMINPGFVKSRLTDKNNFKMPYLISSEEAAVEIYKGLQTNTFDINFPKRFTFWIRFLRYVPDWLYFSYVVRKLKN